jgi:curved DNA-binding protein CbpA
MKKNYYEILGIIETAQLAVIKGAYKALIQIYHPDKFEYEEEKANATEITKEINEAFHVLSDTLLRQKYDEKRKSEYNYNTENKTESRKKDEILGDSWKIATQYIANLEKIYIELTKISPDLGFTFKLEIIESKNFKKARSIANRLENEYLTNYFGSHTKIKSFGKWLLINKKHKIASEVNEAIKVLGNNFNADKFIKDFTKKYNLEYKTKIKRNTIIAIKFLILITILLSIKPFTEKILLLDYTQNKQSNCKKSSIPFKLRKAIINHSDEERSGDPICGKSAYTEENISIATYILEGACGKYEEGENDKWKQGTCSNFYEYFMVGIENGNLIEPIKIGDKLRFFDQEVKIKGKTVLLNGLDHSKEDPACCPTVPTTKEFIILDNKFNEIGFHEGSPAVLSGTYYLKTFENCCFDGKQINETYNHLKLDKSINFISEDEPNGKFSNRIEEIEISRNAKLKPNIKNGDTIEVQCSNIFYSPTMHYALPVYCDAKLITKLN